MAEDAALARGSSRWRASLPTPASQEPAEFTTAPIGAIAKLFAKTGWSAADVDLFEINEAFAMVTMLAMQDLASITTSQYPRRRLRPGPSHRLYRFAHYRHPDVRPEKYGKKRGVAALYIGGGEATAVGIELIYGGRAPPPRPFFPEAAQYGSEQRPRHSRRHSRR